MIKFQAEIARKIIHLSSLWISLIYFFTNKDFILLILVLLSIIAIAIDLSRRFIPGFNSFIIKLVGFMLRNQEKESFAIVGATYLLCSATITIYFFSEEVAIFSLAVLSISDSVAALIGRKFGQKKLVGDKTFAGSCAFFISSIFVYLFFANFCGYSINYLQTILAIFLATLIELFAKKIHIDDNLTIPIVMGIILSL